MTDSRPRPLGDENRHYWLAVGMANRTGTDMQGALEAGQITHQDWADLVQSCRACSWADGCACWLAAQSAGSADVPQTCRNAKTFETLLDRQHEK